MNRRRFFSVVASALSIPIIGKLMPPSSRGGHAGKVSISRDNGETWIPLGYAEDFKVEEFSDDIPLHFNCRCITLTYQLPPGANNVSAFP